MMKNFLSSIQNGEKRYQSKIQDSSGRIMISDLTQPHSKR